MIENSRFCPPSLQVLDYNCDGNNEILFSSKGLNVYIAPAAGGSIIELDAKRERCNLVNTATRREEIYHRWIRSALSGRRGVDKKIKEFVSRNPEIAKGALVQDLYERTCLIDHWLDPMANIESFSQCRYTEQGDFADRPYAFKIEEDEDTYIISLSREGTVWSWGRKVKAVVEKVMFFRKEISGDEQNDISAGGFGVKDGQSSFHIEYRLRNCDKENLSGRFGVEFNFGFAGASQKMSFTAGGSKEAVLHEVKAEFDDVKEFAIYDRERNAVYTLRWNIPSKLWVFPVEMLISRNGNFEMVYQCSTLFPFWALILKPDEDFEFSMDFGIKPIP